MEEVEKFFKCPFCLEKISMLIDLSEDGFQTYIEDCEVCCNPIQLSFEVAVIDNSKTGSEDRKLKGFSAGKAYG